jgi:POLQ-like helicase
MSSSRSLARTWPYPRFKKFEEQLRASNREWFASRDLAASRRMPYILASPQDWPENMILPEIATYIREEQSRRVRQGQGFPLHKYLHHGLSSQAMLFNLIGPLVIQNDLSPLQQAFEKHDIPWPDGAKAIFEYEDREVFNEDSGQPTSIDLVIQGDSRTQALYVEAKLSGKGFGGCSLFSQGDCDGRNPSSDFSSCYLHHIGRRYWKLLEKYGFAEGKLGSESLCPLSIHYQFFRELLFALEKGGLFIMLVDQRNSAFLPTEPQSNRGLIALLSEFIPAQRQNSFGMLTVQKVVATIEATGRHAWISEFKRKYAM